MRRILYALYLEALGRTGLFLPRPRSTDSGSRAFEYFEYTAASDKCVPPSGERELAVKRLIVCLRLSSLKVSKNKRPPP